VPNAGLGKGKSQGGYINPVTGEYGSYESNDLSVGKPGIAATMQFSAGTGNDPGGSSSFAAGGFGFPLFGLYCGASVAKGDEGGLSLTLSIGVGVPTGADVSIGRSDSSAAMEGNVYRNIEKSIEDAYRARRIPYGP
jgi:hypothetical protein